MNFLAHFFVAACVFLAIDAVWIAVVANRFYKDQLHGLLAKKPNFVAAAVFYAIYLWALLYFAVEPALYANDFPYLIKHAAFFGFACYATYDLTNLSTLKNWPLKLTLVDMAWGTFVTTAVAVVVYAVFP